MAAWLTDNTPERGTRSIIIGINGYSNLAGVIAGQLYKKRYAPTYKLPLIITMGIVSSGMIGFFIMRWVYVWTNRTRKREILTWTRERFEEERKSRQRRGDQKKTFIYGY
jgi:hypothetical protein